MTKSTAGRCAATPKAAPARIACARFAAASSSSHEQASGSAGAVEHLLDMGPLRVAMRFAGPRLAEIFADERGNLENQWGKGEEASTEDLRLAFQRYRAFFGRLLSI